MGMLQDIFGKLFGDTGFETPRYKAFEEAAVADLLPYRLYDPERRFYFNEETTGFIVEITAPVGDAAAGNLHAALVSAMPNNAGIQFLNWASPDVDSLLQDWAAARSEGGDIGEAIAASRMAHMRELSLGSTSAIKAIPTERRRFVTGWIEGEPSLSALAGLEEFRRAILGALQIRSDATLLPAQLIDLLSEILHAERWGQSPGQGYTVDLPINAQLPGASIGVTPDHLVLGGQPNLAAKAATAVRFPKEWQSMLNHLLSGEPERLADRPHGPVLTSMTAIAIPAQKATGDILTRRAKMEHSKKTGFAKFVNDFAGKEAELQELSDELESGERLFQTITTVVAYARGGRDEAKAASTEMMKIFRHAGIALRGERYLQLPLFINALPLGGGARQMGAFVKLMRMRLLKGAAVSALAPLHSEWKGNSLGEGMLLLGRQGQVFTWSNFQSEGNYNVAVVGKSGAGKSVLMQELVTSIVANGGRVLVIDDGYSFKTSCEIFGGRHVALDGEERIGLNPFSMLQADKMESPEYAAEAVELLTRVVGTMAALGDQREGRVTGIEEEWISGAVRQVWAEHGPAGEITQVLEVLEKATEEDVRLLDVCAKLRNFARGGLYGNYFEGSATVSVDAPFTVVELSNIKNQPLLEQVVLQLIMFLGTELMYKTPRATPVAIVIDEAWDLLKGGGTAKFIEGVVRRARKYTGALITGTQSIDDYYGNPAANVCLQNSDWTIFMAQRAETIERLEQEGKLAIAPGFGAKLKSVTSVPGQFSELAIKGQGGWAFGRLLLDPFSLAVFSSKGTTVERLKARKEQGMSTVEALKDMVAKGEVA